MVTRQDISKYVLRFYVLRCIVGCLWDILLRINCQDVLAFNGLCIPGPKQDVLDVLGYHPSMPQCID